MHTTAGSARHTAEAWPILPWSRLSHSAMESPTVRPHLSCPQIPHAVQRREDPGVHDAASKVLYSLPETVGALIEALAPARAAGMDFRDLRRLSAEYLSTERRPRYGDMLPSVGPRWLAMQPRYEYLLLEERRGGTSNLPVENLVGALLAVARSRSDEAMVQAVSRLRTLTGGGGSAVDRAAAEWLKTVLSDLDAGLASELAATTTTSEVMEVIKPAGKWATLWYEDGVDDGIEQEIERQLRLLRRLVVSKFGADAASELDGGDSALRDPDVVEAVFAAAIDCAEAAEFMARVADAGVAAGSTAES